MAGYDNLEGDFNASAERSAIELTDLHFHNKLPADYKAFLLVHNGGEGFCGENYVVLFRVEELVAFNQEYEVDRFAPGIVLFGTDGAGEGYGFDTLQEGWPIVRIPLIGMERRYSHMIASRFDDFFDALDVWPEDDE